MNAVTTFKDIANSDKNLETISQLTAKEIYSGNLKDYFTIIPGIKGGKQIATIGVDGYFLKDSSGCNKNADSVAFSGFEQKWNPKEIGINLAICYDQFNDSFTSWDLQAGNNIKDFTQSQVIAKFVANLIQQSITSDIMRVSLLGDENLEAGLLIDNNKLKYYNIIEKGLMPMLIKLKANNGTELADNIVEIQKNSGTGRTNLGENDAMQIFKSLIDKNPQVNSPYIYCSLSLYNNYRDYLLKEKDYGFSEQRDDIQNGLKTIKKDGTTIVPIRDYDIFNKRDFKDGDERYMPHFAVYTEKSNLGIGVDAEKNSIMNNLDMFYSRETDEVRIKGSVKMDFKLLDPTKAVWAI